MSKSKFEYFSIDSSEYIILRQFGTGSSYTVSLMFQIEDKRLFTIKKQNYSNLIDDREDYPNTRI